MFRLMREVRFAINSPPDVQLSTMPGNSYAGFPSLIGFGQYFSLRVTLEGRLDPASQYLRNIKDIDQVIRQRVIGITNNAIQDGLSPSAMMGGLFIELQSQWSGSNLYGIDLSLSPFLSVGCLASEHPMVRLSQKFEFSASHRLHNPALSEEENRQLFGKCNNPFGHGHNYELQVTLRGKPDENGRLIDVPAFERIVTQTVIDRLDHKNLNLEIPEFSERIPTVENIAMTIYRLLKPKFQDRQAKLASVTVWETPKTWCEYSEDV